MYGPSASEGLDGQGKTETVHLNPPASLVEPPATWWDGYRRNLDYLSISLAAKTVIESDCAYIVQHGVMGAGPAGEPNWPLARVRRGLVMGAVQSGKTASMLGVSALCLDKGVDAIVVLAGTTVSLWKQTFERLLDQLDRPGSVVERDRLRMMLPSPSHVLESGEEVPLSRLYAFNRQQARRAVNQRRPLLCVVMKNVHHIRAFSELLHSQFYPTVGLSARPFHLVVLDDEADDGSILDARVESGLDPASADLKQIPRAIVDIWEDRPHRGASALANLHVTYVAYTATPQANFLQSDHNPLAPKDFVIALRTPLDRGALEPRSTTFHEPDGFQSYYTGGEVFYRRAAAASLCIPSGVDGEPDLADAIRAFLVAGAIRLWRETGRLLPSEVSSVTFGSRREALAMAPRPHSMLFHPSATIHDHFDAAASLLMWAGNLSREAAISRVESGDRDLPIEALQEMIVNDSGAWSVWIDRYRSSARAIRSAFDVPGNPAIPEEVDWIEIRDLLIDEVIPSTRFSIVNSDPRADERPQFEPVLTAGKWQARRDLSTIFISGNVMSRGLTLEGLTTTLFLRHSNDPYADTQMQMQRWFGYRGSYLDLCRVFMPEQQLKLFRAYHEGDEALRRDVVKLMNQHQDRAPEPKVLQGRDFVATGKLTNIGNVPLCPGASPFVRLMNDGGSEDPNTVLVAATFSCSESEDVTVNDRIRGRILREPLSLSQTGELLDGLRYENYRPGRTGWQASRWSAIEAHIGLEPGTDTDGLLPLYRPQAPDDGETASNVRSDCPYALGAYLRLWRACLSRHARGIVPTDDPSIPWSMLDLSRKVREQPTFYIGIRYGAGAIITDGALGALPFDVRPMQREVVDGQLVASWGSRNPGTGRGRYLGDEFFDYHVHHQKPPSAAAGDVVWRPVGAPGLVLFHVVEQGGGRRPTVAVGMAIPLGGPDQFAARGTMEALSTQ